MADGAIRGESARRWRGWLRRRRRLVVVVVLVVVLVLAAAGAGWWWAARGPSEPLCLGLYRSDVAPVLEAPTEIVTVDDSPQDADGYWICGINGSNGQILNVHITSHASALVIGMVCRLRTVGPPFPGRSPPVLRAPMPR